jgi:hypothetical protein
MAGCSTATVPLRALVNTRAAADSNLERRQVEAHLAQPLPAAAAPTELRHHRERQSLNHYRRDSSRATSSINSRGWNGF